MKTIGHSLEQLSHYFEGRGKAISPKFETVKPGVREKIIRTEKGTFKIRRVVK